MNVQPYVVKIVENPNLPDDMIKYLQLKMRAEDLQAPLEKLEHAFPSEHSQLITFMDRVEFIDHLSKMADLVASFPEPFTWIDQNSQRQKVVGVDNDIEALRLYLALTCIDIFSDKTLSVRKRFAHVFREVPQEVIDNLQNGLSANGSNNLEAIIEALHSIRNNYTHDGLRFHHIRNISIHQIQRIPVKKENSQIIFEVAPRFDLVEAILRVAVANVHKVLAKHSIC